jgi:putative phosphonate metabolism protein
MRFALYYSPDQSSPFHHSGARWLGYDAFTRTPCDQPGDGLLVGKTKAPSRYGFHATLKPPFRLNVNASYEELETTTKILAELLPTVTISSLVLREMDGFLALVPEHQEESLSELADVCVTALDPLREPPDEAEKQRRKALGLTPRQAEYLEIWGYPYVFQDFRFHVTLTDKLTPEDMPEVHALAARHFANFINQPLSISALTIFAEPDSTAHFFVKKQFPLSSRSTAGPS